MINTPPYMVKAVELHRAFRKLGYINIPPKGIGREENYQEINHLMQQADYLRSKMVCPICGVFHYEEEQILAGMARWDCEKAHTYIQTVNRTSYQYAENKKITLNDQVKLSAKSRRLLPVFRNTGETDEQYLKRMIALEAHVRDRKAKGKKNLFFDHQSYELTDTEKKIIEELVLENKHLTEEQVIKEILNRVDKAGQKKDGL